MHTVTDSQKVISRTIPRRKTSFKTSEEVAAKFKLGFEFAYFFAVGLQYFWDRSRAANHRSLFTNSRAQKMGNDRSFTSTKRHLIHMKWDIYVMSKRETPSYFVFVKFKLILSSSIASSSSSFAHRELHF